MITAFWLDFRVWHRDLNAWHDNIDPMSIRLISSAWSALMDRQHQLPQGLIGRLVGERMTRQHAIETLWTLEKLRLAPNDSVLELGFGAGRALLLALSQTNSGVVVGVDLSPTMIQAARRKLEQSTGGQTAALLRADILALPLVDASFDKIFSIHTYYFWRQSPAVLGDLYRMLSPNGRLVLTMATAKKDAHGEWVYWPLQAILEEEIVPGLKRTGFHEVSLERGPDSRSYNNVALIATR
jgi:SAM-dependent methyltransferase